MYECLPPLCCHSVLQAVRFNHLGCLKEFNFVSKDADKAMEEALLFGNLEMLKTLIEKLECPLPNKKSYNKCLNYIKIYASADAEKKKMIQYIEEKIRETNEKHEGFLLTDELKIYLQTCIKRNKKKRESKLFKCCIPEGNTFYVETFSSHRAFLHFLENGILEDLDWSDFNYQDDIKEIDKTFMEKNIVEMNNFVKIE